MILPKLAQRITVFPEIIKRDEGKRYVRKIVAKSRTSQLRTDFSFSSIRSNQIEVACAIWYGTRQIFHAQYAGIDGCAFFNFKSTHDFAAARFEPDHIDQTRCVQDFRWPIHWRQCRNCQ